MKEADENKGPPELKFIIYEMILGKYKNQQMSLRQFENFIFSLKNMKSKDFRIEIMKRFIINDNHVYSEELLNLYISVITTLGIDN